MGRDYHNIARERHTLFIKSYCPSTNTHVGVTKDGIKERIDPLIGGDLPEGTSPESLVGKTISVEWATGYFWLLNGVKIIADEEKA